MTSFRVRCGECLECNDPDREWIAGDLAATEAAVEYASRFVLSTVERLRQEGTDPDPLHEDFFAVGVYGVSDGFELDPWVAYCIANPAAIEAETDYQALDPNT